MIIRCVLKQVSSKYLFAETAQYATKNNKASSEIVLLAF